VCCAFSALTLLAGRQVEHPACKNWLIRRWCGYLSGVRCRLFALSSWFHCHPEPLSSRALFKSRLVLPFWCRILIQSVLLEQVDRPYVPVPWVPDPDYIRWWVYDGIPYQVKQWAGDRGITEENMEKSQHTDFNEDTTNESASVACSNIQL